MVGGVWEAMGPDRLHELLHYKLSSFPTIRSCRQVQRLLLVSNLKFAAGRVVRHPDGTLAFLECTPVIFLLTVIEYGFMFEAKCLKAIGSQAVPCPVLDDFLVGVCWMIVK